MMEGSWILCTCFFQHYCTDLHKVLYNNGGRNMYIVCIWPSGTPSCLTWSGAQYIHVPSTVIVQTFVMVTMLSFVTNAKCSNYAKDCQVFNLICYKCKMQQCSYWLSSDQCNISYYNFYSIMSDIPCFKDKISATDILSYAW
jgi:hypothetical protein